MPLWPSLLEKEGWWGWAAQMQQMQGAGSMATAAAAAVVGAVYFSSSVASAREPSSDSNSNAGAGAGAGATVNDAAGGEGGCSVAGEFRLLVDLVAKELELDSRGRSGDGSGSGERLLGGLAGRKDDGGGEAAEPASFVGDTIASYASLLMALLALVGVVRFALLEYRLAVRKYRDSEDSDDEDEGEECTAEEFKDEDEDEDEDKPDRKSRLAVRSFTFGELFWYRLDHHLSQSKWATPALLLSVTGFLVLMGTFLLNLSTGQGLSVSAWLAWTYVADPGTHADVGEDGAAVRTVALLITVGGMLVFAMVVGIVSDALGEKVNDLKKGRSRVIESEHTLMLGWTDKSLAIVQEIALANESEGGGTIVVLAEQEKEDMEETLEAAVSTHADPLRLMGTEVVFRSGNPLMENELDKVSASTARSIIALSPDGCDPDEADSRMVRQVLSLKQFDTLKGHVVVEMQDVDNKDLINLVASDIAEVIVAHDMIGRLMIQCAREPGLANVLENLMGFDGAEFYFERWPQLVGRTFLEITCRFDDAVPIGIKGTDGHISINPEDSRVYTEGEEILCLAEDNDTYSPNDGTYGIECGPVPSGLVPRAKAEKLLFCGWRRDMADMIMQLDEYVSKGSELWLFNEVPVSKRIELLRDKGNKEELRPQNLKILNAQGNPIVRRDLKILKALRYDGEPAGQSITLDQFDSVLILADSAASENGEGSLSSDSRSLASLLLMQDIQQKLWSARQKKKRAGRNSRAVDNGASEDDDFARQRPTAAAETDRMPAAPISEILDTRTRSLLRVANCQGYIMSNEIVSGAIAVVSEDRAMNVVLGEILSAEGCETYLRDVSHYVDVRSKKDKRKSFWDIALRARQRREVAVGYKPRGMSFTEASELILNPGDKMATRVWESGDTIIVFAFE